jgi:hypothetical protein
MPYIAIFTLYLCVVCSGFQYLHYICVVYVVDFNMFAIFAFCMSWSFVVREFCLSLDILESVLLTSVT